jgi:formate dehydrogenase major subunit
MLTNPALDPFGKIAELKYCAVKVEKGGQPMDISSYGGGLSFKEPGEAQAAE